MVPREDISLTHGDLHGLNFLASNEDNTEIKIIDYDFADWNPETIDLAHYLNNFCVDHAHPGKDCFIKFYLDNWPTEDEIEGFTKEYLKHKS